MVWNVLKEHKSNGQEWGGRYKWVQKGLLKTGNDCVTKFIFIT